MGRRVVGVRSGTVAGLVGAACWLACLGGTAGAAEAPAKLWKVCPSGALAGQCTIPRGVAADPNLPGHLYVADQTNRRIDEFTVWGVFVKTWGWDVAGEGAAGSGNLTAGSPTVSGVQTTSRAFRSGQEIEAAGIEAGTTIKSVGAGTITLSEPASASGAAVALSAPESPENVPVNELQTVTIGGAPTGGGFSLTYTTPNPSSSTATASEIPFDATAAEVQAKLAGLANIGAGNVEVTGSAGGPWSVEFKGTRFADTNVAQMSASGSGLTPSGTATVATARQGATGFEVCRSHCQTGLPGGAAGQLNAPQGMAVDSEGDVYVADKSNLRVQKFDSEGNFVLMFGAKVDKTKVDESAPAAQQDICTAASGDVCQAGSTGTGPGEFSWSSFSSYIGIGGTGTETTADDTVYVGDAERVQRFGVEGNYLGSVPLPGKTVSALAVDPSASPADLYLAFSGKEDVVKYDLAGTPKCTAEVEDPTAVAADGAGGLYVVDDPPGFSEGNPVTEPRVLEFTPACQELDLGGEEPGFGQDELGTSSPTGLAIGEACLKTGADVYAANPEFSTAFLRAWGPPPDRQEAEACLPPKVPPSIDAQFASTVNPDSAVIRARINPHYWGDARYYAHYATAACIDAQGWGGSCVSEEPAAPGAQLGGGITGEDVTSAGISLGELQPETEYRFRFSAESSGGGPVTGRGGTEAADGADGAFTTPPATPSPGADSCPNAAFRTGAGAHLPDCRAYELVSPVDKGNASIAVLNSGRLAFPARLDQGAAGGDGFAYSSSQAFGDAVAGPYSSQYIATRVAGSEWRSHGISPPHEGSKFNPGALEVEFKAFSADLGSAWLSYEYEPPLQAGAPAGFPSLYRRDNATETYAELVGKAPPSLAPQRYAPELQGLSGDGADTIFRAEDRLTPEASLVAKGTKLSCQGPSSAEFKFEALSYRWLRNGAPIAGKTEAEYKTTAADESAEIQCQATATNSNGGSTQVANPPYVIAPQPASAAPVAPQQIAPPAADEPLVVGGGGGQTLTCDPGSWQGSPSFAFQWYRNGEAIGGATAQTYGVSAGDLAAPAAFQCLVTASNAGGAVAKASELRLSAPGPEGPSVPAPTATMPSKEQLYESSGGRLRLVSALEGGTACVQGASAGMVDRNNSTNGLVHLVEGAVSGDASRIYFSCAETLYLRENPLAPQSASGKCDEADRACTEKVGGEAQFWAASSDGSRAIFTGEGSLREFDAGSGEAPKPIAGGAEGVLGASDDASRVYFTTSEALEASNVQEVSGEGAEAQSGRPNLYLYERGEGGGEDHYVFIGTLAGGDRGAVEVWPVLHLSAVSPDGLSAAFMSSAPLTGYDNTDAESNEADAEVFHYDARSDRLACVSCNPSGARPSGKDLAEEYPLPQSGWAAARIPGWATQLYQPRYLSADGRRLFFESFEALLPRDTNGQQDVYEWEQVNGEGRQGKEECAALGAGRFVASSGGCLSLISSGESTLRSEFLDAGEGGRDVFFTTLSSLVSYDPGLVDIYDAREGGGLPAPPTPKAPCQGEACQGPAAAPGARTPASSEFSQEGNVAPKKSGRCPKGRRRVRRHGKARCVKKRHHRRHHGHRRRGPRHHRRAGR